MTIFERIVRAAARRPARVLVIVAVFAAVGCALALRLEPSAATDTLVGRGADTYKATERYREKFGDHSVIVLVRGELSNLLLTSNLGRADRARGLPVGQQARRPGRRRAGRSRRAGGSRRSSRSRSSTGRARSPTRRSARSTTSSRRGSRRSRRRPTRRPSPPAQYREGAGEVAGGAEAAGRLGAPARLRPVRARPAPDQPQVRPRARPGCRGSTTRTSSRRCSSIRRAAPRRRRRASPTCSRRKAGADPGAAASRPQRRAAGARRSGSCARRCAMPEWQLKGDAALHGDRRARVAEDLADALAGSLCGCCSSALAGDGDRAGAGLPQPAAAVAAADRARRRGDHVRGDVARGRAADDGVDRGAAGPARARGRLRDPVPGAGAGDADRRSGPRASRCRRSRRPRSPPGRASSSCCCRRCRWCAASACCSWPASQLPSCSL